MKFICQYKDVFGVEPICRVLNDHGVKVVLTADGARWDQRRCMLRMANASARLF